MRYFCASCRERSLSCCDRRVCQSAEGWPAAFLNGKCSTAGASGRGNFSFRVFVGFRAVIACKSHCSAFSGWRDDKQLWAKKRCKGHQPRRNRNRHNKQPVIRFNVVYKTADGRNVETYFETWDFNVYPPANSVRYPNVSETFRIAYLPSYPTAFLILTEDPSPYSKAAECGELISDVEEKRLRFEFDPNNPDYRREYEKAVANAAEKKCGIVESKPSRPNDPGALR